MRKNLFQAKDDTVPPQAELAPRKMNQPNPLSLVVECKMFKLLCLLFWGTHKAILSGPDSMGKSLSQTALLGNQAPKTIKMLSPPLFYSKALPQ